MLEDPPQLGIRSNAELRVIDVSDDWHRLASELGLRPFAAEALVGRSITDFLASGSSGEPRRSVESWLRSLVEPDPRSSRGTPCQPPPAPLHLASDYPFIEAISPWPVIEEGTCVGLWLSLRRISPESLARPLFLRQGEEGEPGRPRARPLGHAAAELLDRNPDLAEVANLGDWLASHQPPLCLEATGLILDGAPILFPRRHLAYRRGAFSLLSRMLRSTLHDSSNSLAAVRMLSEVLMRGGARSFERYADSLPSMIEHLDRVNERLGRLRSMAVVEARTSAHDVAALFADVVDTFHSEWERRELRVEVETGDGCRVEARQHLLLLLLTGMLLSAIERAEEGQTLRFSCSPSPERRVELRIEGEGSPRPALDPSTELLRSLAAAVGGNFEADGRLWSSSWPAAAGTAAAGPDRKEP